MSERPLIQHDIDHCHAGHWARAPVRGVHRGDRQRTSVSRRLL